ncbi:MAG: helix-turn-helix domain-containing protein [Planctomycetes bacterium]|nr:helix-turn-helix domain-containing protein [Planctomycetota bacterium]
MQMSDEFGVTLHQFRETKGFSQKKLAEKVGVTHSTVSRWETSGGQPKPNRDKVIELGKALGLDKTDTDTLLSKAGYARLGPGEIDIERMLDGLRPRWRQTWLLHHRMKWTEDRVMSFLRIDEKDFSDDVRIGADFELLQLQRPEEQLQTIVDPILNELKTLKKNQNTEPTRVDPFARQMRDRVHVPSPEKLLVNDLSEGEIQIYDKFGREDGHFYWDSRTGEPAIWLYDGHEHQPDTFLEKNEHFEKFLDKRRRIRPLVNAYKKHGIEYVKGAYKLRDLIETMILKQLLERGYREKIEEELKLNKRIFDDIYVEVIRRFELEGKTDEEKEKVYKPEYTITKARDGIWQLSLGGLSIAKGPAKDLQELKMIHKAAVDSCMMEHSETVEHVLETYEKARGSGEKLRDEL